MKTPFWQRLLAWAILTSFVVLFLSPLAWIAVTSVKPEAEIYDAADFRVLPRKATLEHYRHVFSQLDDFPVYCWNTARVTAVTILVVLAASSLCGYALARLPFYGGGSLMTLLLFIMAIPWMVMLIPIYRMEVSLGLLNTLPGLILPYSACFLPMAILIMRSAFLAVPGELREAALVDGAGELRTWFRVMLPIVRPSMVVVLLMTFLSCWKEYTYAVTLNSLPSATTLAVGITYLKDEAQSWAYGTLSATIVTVAAPLVLVFLCFQKQLIGGLSEGALKG